MKNYTAPKFELINMFSTDVIASSGEPMTVGDPANEMTLDFSNFGLN